MAPKLERTSTSGAVSQSKSPARTTVPEIPEIEDDVTATNATNVEATRTPVELTPGWGPGTKSIAAPTTRVAVRNLEGAAGATESTFVSNQTNIDAFARMTPAERKAKFAEVRAARQQLSGRVTERLGQLDGKWRALPPEQKAEALRRYQGARNTLDPAARRAFRSRMQELDTTHQSIAALRGQLQTMPAAATRAQAARAQDVASKLEKLETKAAAQIEQAAQAVEGGGLKSELLAIAESVIDPIVSALGGGIGSSLMDMMSHLFQLDTLFIAFNTVMDMFTKQVDETVERHTEERKAKQQEHVRDQLLADRVLADSVKAKRDMFQRLSDRALPGRPRTA